MNNTPYKWKITISPYLIGFIDERHLGGFRFRVQERWIKQFDRYCSEKGIRVEYQ
jgi:hypothetical protein